MALKVLSRNVLLPALRRNPIATWRILAPVAHAHTFADIPVAPLNTSEDAEHHLHSYANQMHKEFGPLFVQYHGPMPILFIADAETNLEVYQSEGMYPEHFMPAAWTYYLNEVGKKRGLFFMDGPEWLESRKVLNKVLLQKNSMKNHVQAVSAVCKDFVNLWHTNSPNSNLEYQLYSWNIECVGMVAFGLKLGFFDKLQNSDEFSKEKDEFIDAIHQTFFQSAKILYVPPEIAKVSHKETWDIFCSVVKKSLEMGNCYVRKGIDACSSDNTSEDVRNSVLYQLLKKENMDEELATRLIVDLILASADTTTQTAVWILYLLGRNPDVAQKAREQICSLKNEPLSLSTLNKYTYINGIIKETMRLYPIATFLTRSLAKDAILSGYEVPAKTMVVSSLYTMGRNKDYYEDPLSFKPERWFKESKSDADCSHVESGVIVRKAYTPWGLGKRSCVGRQTAELELSCLLIHALSSFEWTVDQDIEPIMRMVIVPSENVVLNLKPI